MSKTARGVCGEAPFHESAGLCLQSTWHDWLRQGLAKDWKILCVARGVGRQSKLAPNPLPGSPLLAPRAQGEELAVHKLCSLEVEAEDYAC